MVQAQYTFGNICGIHILVFPFLISPSPFMTHRNGFVHFVHSFVHWYFLPGSGHPVYWGEE